METKGNSHFLASFRAVSALAIAMGCNGGESCGRAQAPRSDTRDAEVADAAAQPLVVASAPAAQGDGGRPIETKTATSLGTNAFTANGRIHPHGLPTTYWFEYGSSTSYGSKTQERPLPPRLVAFYRETWDEGFGGWAAGMSLKDLIHAKTGGVSGGFVRSHDTEGAADDTNHLDGIGVVHLSKFFYPGTAWDQGSPTAALGGGDPDLRDARISVHVRGYKFKPSGAELVFWMQCDKELAHQDDADWRRANWAYTGFTLTDFLASGKWERVEYRLENDSTKWTYAGNSVNQMRPNYIYWSLDSSLAHVNNDLFHMLVFVDQAAEPSGGIDYDDLEIAYRNYNLLLASNGGRLVSAPEGAPDDASKLTDGWRNGAGHTWRSPPSPKGPVEVVYELGANVLVERIQIHQHPEVPSEAVEILSSMDGKSWTSVLTTLLPKTAPEGGKNFAFFLDRSRKLKTRFVKVRVTSGYQPSYWGLGEVEMFGTGAVMKTDEDFYNVNQDITGLVPGTYHYRVVAKNSAGTLTGEDRTFKVPNGAYAEVTTGAAIRIGGGTADLHARVNTLGKPSEYYFEYGLDEKYGEKTEERMAGQQLTPRTVHRKIDGLTPGKTYHYRVVVVGPAVTTHGQDATFVAK